MRGAVLISKLVDRYTTEYGIAVKPEEIDAYLDSLYRVAEQDRRRQEARREELARKLEAKTLPDAERQSLSSELDSLNEFLNNTGEARNGAKEDSAEDKVARRQMARPPLSGNGRSTRPVIPPPARPPARCRDRPRRTGAGR